MADPVFVDDVTPLDAANMNKLQTRDEKAAANGYPSLGADGKVPLAQLPAIGGGADLSYDGDWVAGTYQDGDVVVKDGIAYICVGGPTTAAPSIAPWGQAGLSVIGDEMAYAEVTTTSIALPANTEATAQEIVAAPPITCDGVTPILIEFFAPQLVTPNVAGGLVILELWDDATYLGRWHDFRSPTANNFYATPRLTRRLTPAAGTHIYRVKAFVQGGSASMGAGVGSGGIGVYQPIFIRVSRVFPTPPQVGVGALTAVTYGTSLPASPADGQEAILVDSLTAATYSWRFRFNASRASNKWEFIGGPPLGAFVAAREALAASTTVYQDLPTPGPSVAIPVAGIYELEMDCLFGLYGTGFGFMAYAIGGTGPTDADAVASIVSSSGNADTNAYMSRRKTFPVGTLTAKYRFDNILRHAENRRVRVTPVAVGG